MSDAAIREVDGRYLEPPEPFVQAMAAVDALAPGESVRLLLFREPFPLYKVLDDHGFRRQTELQADGTFVILIRREP